MTEHTADISFRPYFLVTVSALALAIAAHGGKAQAADDTPPLWIEAGWQFEKLSGTPEPFGPHFAYNPSDTFISPISIEQGRQPFSYGAEGEILFQPDGSDWVFSAAVRYGRATRHKNIHQQTTPSSAVGYVKRLGYPTAPLTIEPNAANLRETNENDRETHLFADFQVGRDVGLGLFGNGSTSTLSLGVRYAQFRSKSDTSIHAVSNFRFVPVHVSFSIFKVENFYQYWTQYQGAAHSERSFAGVGPIVSWNASARMLGNSRDGAVDIDWGANAALLFGRQKARGVHQTSSYDFAISNAAPGYAAGPLPHNRSREVTVPDLGGFAGLSFNYANAKLKLGYRADFFFGAVDGGIDTAHRENVGFYGPFASISVGLGG